MSIPHGLKRTLVIASGNAGKVREFRELLQQLPLELQPQPEGMEVEEIGLTFAENAPVSYTHLTLPTICSV